MPQELNKIWNAGKLFEPKPEPEQPAKQPESEPNPSTIKRKKSVIGAFMDKQEDPFKEKVEAVLKGIEESGEETKPASAPAMAGKEEKPVSPDTEVIVGTGQNKIGKNLATGKSICVEGNAGDYIGDDMSGGKIYVEGNAGERTGFFMFGGEIHVKGDSGNNTGVFMGNGTLHIDGDVASFDKTAFRPDNKGTIIWKGQTIWENGQKVEHGWTNLKVKEKIAK
ncbi:MAG: hypothetical protein WC878_08125 [Candidatus Paceibacterota bacterium]|jgi:hypothetical protein